MVLFTSRMSTIYGNLLGVSRKGSGVGPANVRIQKNLKRFVRKDENASLVLDEQIRAIRTEA